MLKLGQRAAKLQDHDLAHHIGLHIGVGVHQRMADPCLGGEMDDPGDRFTLRLNRRRRGLAIGNVGAGESEGLVRLQQGEPRLLEADVIVVVQIVDAENALAARLQRLADMEPDEAGGPGHEDRHPLGNSRSLRPGRGDIV